MEIHSKRIVNELDQVIAGIFDVMADVPCGSGPADVAAMGNLCMEVEFDRGLRGRCLVRMNRDAAESYACAILGPAETLCDAICEDSVSELCNMIAGGWKSLQPLPSGCAAMSPPFVCRQGGDDSYLQALLVRVKREYRFGCHGFQVEMMLNAEDVSQGAPA